MIHLRTLGIKDLGTKNLGTKDLDTKDLDTREFRRHRPRLIRGPHRQSMEQETPWPRCRPHDHRVTTACLLSDFALRSHRMRIASQRSLSPACIVLFYPTENRLSFILVSYSCKAALVIFILYCRTYVSRDRRPAEDRTIEDLHDSFAYGVTVLYGLMSGLNAGLDAESFHTPLGGPETWQEQMTYGIMVQYRLYGVQKVCALRSPVLYSQFSG